ncbi:MAG: hypothetical protein AAF531_13160 [Actinomycetota bacterium]
MAYQSTFESVLAFIGLVLVVVLGAWWTGTAVAEGMVGATMLRFCLSVFGGCYYLVLYRIARYGAGRRTRRIS